MIWRGQSNPQHAPSNALLVNCVLGEVSCANESPAGGGFLATGFRLAAGGLPGIWVRFWAAREACCDWNRFTASCSADMVPAGTSLSRSGGEGYWASLALLLM